MSVLPSVTGMLRAWVSAGRRITLVVLTTWAVVQPRGGLAAATSPENNPLAPTRDQVQARFSRIQQEVDRLRAAGQAGAADQLSSELQHFRQQLAGLAPSTVAGPELDVVGVYEGRNVTVNVGPTGRPLVLALSSVRDVSWGLNLQPGASLQKVIVFGPDTAKAPANLPPGVPVEFVGNGISLGYQKDLSGFPSTARALYRMTGLQLSSMQGTYGAGDATFTVGDGGRDWAAQRVLADMQPLYKEATAFQLAADRAASQRYRFPALDKTFATGSPYEFAGSSRIAQFTPAGPVAGTMRPVPAFAHLAVDPAGPTYYGVRTTFDPARFDEAANAWTPLPLGERVGIATGLTFDTRRNRLVLSATGGEPYLLTYSPEQGGWQPLASKVWEQLFSVTYSDVDDALYALTAENPDSPLQLARYDAESGVPMGIINLSRAIPAEWLFEYQLTAAGDRLSLITPPISDLYEPYLAPTEKAYLINPHTGDVVFLGDVAEVPEPRAGAALFAGVVVLLLRRGPAGCRERGCGQGRAGLGR